MEPVKTCATCRHSVVGRRDPMDWWKRRLCAHPGLVDRVEGRPLYEALEARSKERECGPAGTLWEGPSLLDVKPTKLIVRGEMLEDARRLMDPVDELVDGFGVPAHGAFTLDANGIVRPGIDGSITIPDTLLPRKPAKRARRRGEA